MTISKENGKASKFYGHASVDDIAVRSIAIGNATVKVSDQYVSLFNYLINFYFFLGLKKVILDLYNLLSF